MIYELIWIITTKNLNTNVQYEFIRIMAIKNVNSYIHLASCIEPETRGDLFTFQITINSFWATYHPSFQVQSPVLTIKEIITKISISEQITLHLMTLRATKLKKSPLVFRFQYKRVKAKHTEKTACFHSKVKP